MPVTSANQPRSRRIGLLIDSLSTSRYGHSFVRIGGTLYAMPITQSHIADAKKYLLSDQASAKPAAASASHSMYAMAGRTRPDGTGRYRFTGWSMSFGPSSSSFKT